MSDVDNENISSFVEDETEESFSPNSLRKKRTTSNLKHPRQKYCERWEAEFPWLKADKVDESLGICTICKKQLVCKKSHLERHQNSFRHQRIAGFEIVTYSTDNKNAEYLVNENEKKDYDQYEYMHLENEEYVAEDLPNLKKNESSTIIERHRLTKSITHPVPKEQKVKLNRLKLLKRIDNDRSKLNEYYYSRLKELPSNFTPSPIVQPQRDTFDLFFDSVSASVKVLPPKLAYEIKSKVSQLLTEYELRALCEKEAEAARESHTTETPVVTSAFRETAKSEVEASPDGIHLYC